MLDPSKIPGMIEPVEQAMLTELAASVPADELIVEFGTFFGRSTACLVNGAMNNGAKVQAFDSFGCAASGEFANFVRGFAQQGGVLPLVGVADGRVDFLPVYRHFVGAAETAGVLTTHRAELREVMFGGGRIGLIHLDAPKFYDELKPVLARFFPSLVPGGVVVFQDYFYHWSATLIAGAQVLFEAGFLKPERSAASSLVARVVRTPTAQDLIELDLTMAATPCEALIDRAIRAAAGLQMDRPEAFAPRLALAKMQHLWTQGRYGEAEMTFRLVVENGLRRDVFNDYLDLMRHGLNLRRGYDLDH